MTPIPPFPLVTIELLDWFDGARIFALPLKPMSSDQIDCNWSYPNKGGIEKFLDAVGSALNYDGIVVPWEFRGIRWVDSIDENGNPPLLPGEAFVRGGPAALARYIEACEIAYERDPSWAEGGHNPYEGRWDDFSVEALAELRDLTAPSP